MSHPESTAFANTILVEGKQYGSNVLREKQQELCPEMIVAEVQKNPSAGRVWIFFFLSPLVGEREGGVW